MNFPDPLLSPKGLIPVQWPVHRTHDSVVNRLIGLHPEFQGASATERLSSLSKILKNGHNQDLSEQKKTLLLRRVGWRMRVHKIRDFGRYLDLLASDPAELPALRKCLSMRVTDFFRNLELLYAIEKHILPGILGSGSRTEVNVLIEEPDTCESAYSIAMVLDCFRKKTGSSASFHILACTSDTESLYTAKDVMYSRLITADLSPFCLNTFFDNKEKGYRINEYLEKQVSHKQSTLLDLATVKKFDLIVPSYPVTAPEDKRSATVDGLLKPGGYTILKPGASAEAVPAHYDLIDPTHGMYRKGEQGRVESKTTYKLPPELIAPYTTPKDIESMVEDLEIELHSTRERVNVAIDEYETTYDELAQSNRKLQEEIRRLSSENDESHEECNALRSMVATLKKTNDTLTLQHTRYLSANNSLENILSISGIGILHLNRDLCVEMYTPDIAHLFELKKKDLGRPLSDLSIPFQWKLAEAAQSVLRSESSLEHECRSSSGTWYRIKLASYVNHDNVSGVVCSFLNITESRREQEWDRFRANILNHIHDAIIVTNRRGRVTYVNNAAIDRYGLFNRKKTGFHVDDLYLTSWESALQEETAMQILKQQKSWSGEVYHISGGKRRRVNTTLHMLEDEMGEEIGRLTVIRENRGTDARDNEFLRHIIADLSERNETLDLDLMS